ncbi:hypothetical protein Pmani_019687 [Petrolisthes manimaculis]|uniref:Uncharacterized protein n=1 Tax=Petrolisthes manimaculis TaxID=1843537 RepID=A0AAE1U3B1_9EUCA|nr:hypothetical protein Pmani_019687 [Petrolisthes manimaculis]
MLHHSSTPTTASSQLDTNNCFITARHQQLLHHSSTPTTASSQLDTNNCFTTARHQQLLHHSSTPTTASPYHYLSVSLFLSSLALFLFSFSTLSLVLTQPLEDLQGELNPG